MKHTSVLSAAAVFLLVQLTVSLVGLQGLQCPTNISEKCNCQMEPEFILNCSNNNRKISLTSESMGSPWPDLKFECVNKTDGEIFKLFRFDQINLTKSVHKLTINSCPHSVIQLIESSVINHIDPNSFEITTTDLMILPQNIFRNLTNLSLLYFEANNLGTLPANVFAHLAKLQELKFKEDTRRTLPDEIFNNHTDLVTFHLIGTNLRRLSANIFQNLTKLKTMALIQSQLTTLPENIFEHQTNLQWLFLHGNQLNDLLRKYFWSLNKVGVFVS